MSEEKKKPLSITPALIEADLDIAKELYYNRENFKNNPFLMNMCAYHSAQVVEKCLKLILHKDNYSEFQEVEFSHSIDAFLNKIAAERDDFASTHKDLYRNAYSLTLMNTARYDSKPTPIKEVHNALHSAKQLFKEIALEFGKPIYEQTEKPKDLCENSNQIDKALSLFKKNMAERKSVDTVGGKAFPQDGYEISNITAIPKKGIVITATMLTRSQEEQDIPREKDKCSFHISKGKVYTEKEWDNRFKQKQVPIDTC